MSILDRDLIDLNAVSRRLPGKPHRATLWRWCTRGFALPDGSRVYLNVVRIGRRCFCAPEDIEAFAKALTEGQRRPTYQPDLRKSSLPRHSSRHEQANREAEALGI